MGDFFRFVPGTADSVDISTLTPAIGSAFVYVNDSADAGNVIKTRTTGQAGTVVATGGNWSYGVSQTVPGSANYSVSLNVLVGTPPAIYVSAPDSVGVVLRGVDAGTARSGYYVGLKTTGYDGTTVTAQLGCWDLGNGGGIGAQFGSPITVTYPGQVSRTLVASIAGQVITARFNGFTFTVTDTANTYTAAGYVGVTSYASTSPGNPITVGFSAIAAALAAPSAAISPTTSTPGATGVAFTLTGAGTLWDANTLATISGGTGASITAQSIAGQVITGTFNAGSAAGPLTFGTNYDATAVTVNVAAGASISISPATVTAGTPESFALTGSGTAWTSGTTASVTGGTGASITAQSIAGQVITGTINPGTSTNGNTLTFHDSTDSATTTMSVTAGSPTQNLAPNNACILFSPYNWSIGSGVCVSNNPGAYFSALFSGVSGLMTFNTSNNTAYFPQIWWRIDGGVWTKQAVTSSIDLTKGTPFANTVHFLEVIFSNCDTTQVRWTGNPQTAIYFTGLTVDSSATLLPPPRRPLSILIYGDSISEGYNAISGTEPGGQDAQACYSLALRDYFNAEVGVVAFAAQGYQHVGNGGVPVGPSTYNLQYAGVARTFTPVPDLVITAWCANDIPDSTAFAMGTKTIWDAMIALGVTKIAQTGYINPAAFYEPYVANVVAAYSNPGGTVTFIDMTGYGYVNAPGIYSSDGTHPYAAFHLGEYAPRLAASIKSAGLLGGSSPAASDVRQGVMTGSVPGTLAVPTASQTLIGIAVDHAVGNVTQPATSTVEAGTAYGPSLSLTGTYVGGSGSYPSASQLVTAFWSDLLTSSDFTNPGSVGAAIKASLSASGATLAPSGLDQVAIEVGMNARQALSPIAAFTAGTLAGAGSGTIVIHGAGVDTPRITATTDASGNRSAITLNLPN